MSYSEMHGAGEDGDVHGLKEYRNGHGYAMPVWTYLARKYLRKPGEDHQTFWARWYLHESCKGVWALAKDDRLERWELVSLACSFDHAVVKREDFAEVADAFDRMGEEYRKIEPDNVNHYPEMAKDIRALPETTLAICWTATSVGDNLWYVHDDCECPKCGDSHRQEEGRPYNLNRDKEHWYVGHVEVKA